MCCASQTPYAVTLRYPKQASMVGVGQNGLCDRDQKIPIFLLETNQRHFSLPIPCFPNSAKLFFGRRKLVV